MVARRHKLYALLGSFLTCILLMGASPSAWAKEDKLSAGSEQEQRVSINRASLEDLQVVRGIGPVIAQRIVDFRQANGSFSALEDLVQVNGIGRAKYEKIKEQLTL